MRSFSKLYELHQQKSKESDTIVDSMGLIIPKQTNQDDNQEQILSECLLDVPTNHKAAKVYPYQRFATGALAVFKRVSKDKISGALSYLEETRIITNICSVTASDSIGVFAVTIYPVICIINRTANYANDKLVLSGELNNNILTNIRIISPVPSEIETYSLELIETPEKAVYRTQSICGVLIERDGRSCKELVNNKVRIKFIKLSNDLNKKLEDNS